MSRWQWLPFPEQAKLPEFVRRVNEKMIQLAQFLAQGGAGVAVRKNTGLDVGRRPRLNLIEGANVTLTVADDPANDEVDVTIAGPAGGSGEANTASNVNTTGVGVFKQKTGVNLEFRGIDNGSSRIVVGLNALNNVVTVDVSEINLLLQNLGGDLTLAQIAQIATDKLLGRQSAGTGDVETIACTAAGRALIDDADAAAQRATLGLGALATKATIGTGDIDADAVTYAKLQNVSATQRILARKTAAAGDVEECTISELLDFISSTRGAVLYRGAAGWVALAPGTSGQVLQTNGAGADPTWVTPASGSSPWTPVPKTADQNRSSTTAAAADSQLTIALAANTRYKIRGSVQLRTANATMDFKYGWGYTGTFAAGNSVQWQRRHAAAGAAAGTDNDNTFQGDGSALPGTASVAATTSGLGYVEFEVTVLTNTAGTFSFDWAQNTSDPGNLTVCAGSYLEYMTV